MTVNAAPCFCCSEIPFSECCEPVLRDHAKALTPLMLMRSRYTAYVLKNETYLLATWAPSTRPTKIDLENSTTKWLKLLIHSTGENPDLKDTGHVTYSAMFLENEYLCTLKENSRFIRHKHLWYYLDGETEIHQDKIGRNSDCPCGSGKKFKRCCLRN